MENDEIKKMLEENLKLTREIYVVAKKVKRFIFWQQIYGILKILIIVVPIILGIIYLPPLLARLFEQSKNLLSEKGVENILEAEKLKNLIPLDGQK